MEVYLLESIIPRFVEHVNGSIIKIENKLMIYYLYLQIDTNISFDCLKEVYRHISQDRIYSTSIIDLQWIDSDLKITIEINHIKRNIYDVLSITIDAFKVNYHPNVIRYEYNIVSSNKSIRKLYKNLKDPIFYQLLIPQLEDKQKRSYFFFEGYYRIGERKVLIDEYTDFIDSNEIKFKLTIYLDPLKIDYHPSLTMDALGGLSREQILTSPFVFISHQTYYNSLEIILSSGKFKTKPELANEGIEVYGGIYGSSDIKIALEKTIKYTKQFPGFYTRLICQENLRDYTPSALENSITLILSLSLLRLHNYHWNDTDLYGSINNQTFVPETIVKYLPYIRQLWPGNGYSLNDVTSELIFLDGFSIDFIEGVIIDNAKLIPRLQNLFTKYNLNIPIYFDSQTTYDYLIQLQFIKYLDADLSIINHQPQLCYSNQAGERVISYATVGLPGIPYFKPFQPINFQINRRIEAEYIKEKQLKNCGLKPHDDPKLILEKMEDIYFGSGERVPVKNEEDLPPFKYTPSYYGIEEI